MMPGIDGFEFTKTVREVKKTIPILFMTARDDFASKQKGDNMRLCITVARWSIYAPVQANRPGHGCSISFFLH